MGSREAFDSPPRTMKVRVSESAVQDLLAGFRFYEQQAEAIGDYFLDSLFADIDSLVLYAGLHEVVHSYHRMVAKRFPFAIYYKIEQRTAHVYRVLDCRRSPTWTRKQLKR
jgi:plasmid stabilization system protein ParE